MKLGTSLRLRPGPLGSRGGATAGDSTGSGGVARGSAVHRTERRATRGALRAIRRVPGAAWGFRGCRGVLSIRGGRRGRSGADPRRRGSSGSRGGRASSAPEAGRGRREARPELGGGLGAAGSERRASAGVGEFDDRRWGRGGIGRVGGRPEAAGGADRWTGREGVGSGGATVVGRRGRDLGARRPRPPERSVRGLRESSMPPWPGRDSEEGAGTRSGGGDRLGAGSAFACRAGLFRGIGRQREGQIGSLILPRRPASWMGSTGAGTDFGLRRERGREGLGRLGLRSRRGDGGRLDLRCGRLVARVGCGLCQGQLARRGARRRRSSPRGWPCPPWPGPWASPAS